MAVCIIQTHDKCKLYVHVQDPPVLPELLLHSSPGVRAAALQLVAALAAALNPADGFAYLLPQLLPALSAAPADLTSVNSLLRLLKAGELDAFTIRF